MKETINKLKSITQEMVTLANKLEHRRILKEHIKKIDFEIFDLAYQILKESDNSSF